MLRKQMYRGKKTSRLKKESREVFFCYVFIYKKEAASDWFCRYEKTEILQKNKKIEKFC